jgi:transposase
MQPSGTMKPYQSDSSDGEWAFVAPYLSLLPPEGVQRRHDLRRVFDALKWIAWTGAPWRALPHDFPPWPIVHQQAMRWLAAGVFEAMVHDLRGKHPPRTGADACVGARHTWRKGSSPAGSARHGRAE